MKNKRLKIGLFIDNFYPSVDGVVLVVDNLAKELSKFNDVVVIAPLTYDNDIDDTKPYKIVRVPSLPVPFSEYRIVNRQNELSYTYHKLLKENFDVIHIHSPFNIGKLGIRIAKKKNIPSIVTLHTRFDFEIKKVIDNKSVVKSFIKNIVKTYSKCDKSIAVNYAMIKVFNDYGYKKEPIVIYNGTDLKKSSNKELEETIKRRYGINKEIPTLLFVGRLTDIKNIFFILDSLKLLKEDNFKFKMLYVGSGPDEKKLKEKIKEYNLDKDVILTGKITKREELSAIYKVSNLFLFPSLFDASSLVQIEAAVNGTPGLFIEGSVTSDTIINDENGFTCQLDEKEYKDKIKSILMDKENLNRVSKNAEKTLGKSWKELALETYEVYIDEIGKMKNEKTN